LCAVAQGKSAWWCKLFCLPLLARLGFVGAESFGDPAVCHADGRKRRLPLDVGRLALSGSLVTI
ncbi:MAG: hypothetical protein VKK63_11600, partial [Synechococcus sp.]|nr:hypothetical protein [Synechococcus sp.]